MKRRRVALATVAGAAVLVAAAVAQARVGGGHSYSGGSHGGGYSGGYHGSGGGGGGGDIVELLVWLCIFHPAVGIPVVLVVIAFFVMANRSQSSMPRSWSSAGLPGGDGGARVMANAYRMAGLRVNVPVDALFARLRHYDPNFSRVAFDDFVYALYARVHEARGGGTLDRLSPYLSESARDSLEPGPPAIRDVSGVIVGAASVLGVSDPDADENVRIAVRFETNYRETRADGRTETFYAVELWFFERRRDALSPKPEDVTALHCPKCGGELETNPDGSCPYCGVTVSGGDFAWFVAAIAETERESRGPTLTGYSPERGTDRATILQPGFEKARSRWIAAHPQFAWPRTEARFRNVFFALQDAWSSLAWEKARPYETDPLFQMHRYWIDAYREQKLRNALEDVEVSRVVPVKFQEDAFYEAITVRIFASIRDYTVDAGGDVVGGDRNHPRRFSEYWTFVRRAGTPESTRKDAVCPNCGAPLDKVNMAGVCEYCGGKITRGDFDWVLARIEQDESYLG